MKAAHYSAPMVNTAVTINRTLLVFYLWVAGLCAAAQYGKFSILFPYLRELYPSTSSVTLGLLVSIVGILGVVLGLSAGLIVARLGFKNMLIPALILASTLSLFQASLPSFGWMLFSRLLEGGSHLIIVVAAPTLIARHCEAQHRALAMTLWSTFFGVAFALIVWLGLPMVELYGPQSLFMAHAVLSLIIAIVLARQLPADPAQTNAVESVSFAYLLKQHTVIYRSPFISAPAIGWLFYTLTFVSLLTILPDQLISGDQKSLVGVMPLLGIAVALLSGVFLLSRFTAIQVLITGFLLAAAVTLSLSLGIDPVWCGLLIFGTLGLVQGSGFAAIPELNKDTQSQAYANGAMAQMGNLGNTLGTPLFLVLLSTFGIHGLVAGAVACYLVAAGWHIHLAKARVNQPKHVG